MSNTNRKYLWPMSLAAGLAVIGAIALVVALTTSSDPIQAQGGASDSTAVLTLSTNQAEPGDTIMVRGYGFRVGGSFIYTSTITIGDLPIAKVDRVDLASAFLHAGRTTDGGTYIAQHIDMPMAFVFRPDLTAGDHELKVRPPAEPSASAAASTTASLPLPSPLRNLTRPVPPP